MELKIKTLYVFIILLSASICQAQNEFSNIAAYNRVFDNPPDPNVNNKNMPTLADFDLDGNLDLMVSYRGNQKIWRGTGTMGWSSIKINIDGVIGNIPMGACVWADLDNDELLDLIITPVSGMKILRQKKFFRNTLYFEDVSYLVNNKIGSFENRVAIGDINKDGKLDLLLTKYASNESTKASVLLLQNPNSFTFNVDDFNEPFLSHGAKLCDYDSDGDLDVYVGSYRDDTNKLLKWDNGLFSEAEEISTILRRGHSNGTPANCTGVEWLDYDNDGDFDLFVSNLKHGSGPERHYGASELFENVNGVLTVIDQVDKGLLSEPYSDELLHHAQQTASFDYDNDGDIDIIQPRSAQGNCASRYDGYVSKLYVNDIDNKYFEPVTILDDSYNDNFGVVIGDCNSDGDIDMFTAANYDWGCNTFEIQGVEIEWCSTCDNSEVSDIKYLTNELNNNNQFVKLRLEGDTPSNKLTAGIGAEIYIDNNDGGIMSRLVEISTSGQKVGTGYIKHFGLGDWNSEVTNVYVKWLDTPVGKLERFELTIDNINNSGAPYIIKKNEGEEQVERIFYCEEGKTLEVDATKRTYTSNKYVFTTALATGEQVIDWEVQVKKNTIEDKFSGNWLSYRWASDTNSTTINYSNRYDMKARALIEDASGKRCYSKVAYGFGNINNGEDKLISGHAGLNTSLISVSPNPTNNLITVKLNFAETTQEFANNIALYNSNGAVVYSKNLDDYSMPIHQISMADLSPGIYFVTVQTADNVASVKVIKR